MNFQQRIAGVAVLLVWISAEVCEGASKRTEIEYNRDVRPILSENCFVCHGADSGSRKAKLRLDSFEEATVKKDGSDPVIVPGKPGENEVINRITNPLRVFYFRQWSFHRRDE